MYSAEGERARHDIGTVVCVGAVEQKGDFRKSVCDLIFLAKGWRESAGFFLRGKNKKQRRGRIRGCWRTKDGVENERK